MLTDNWPVDFMYISRRIVKEIVQQHEAGRAQRAFKIGFTGSIGVGPVRPGVNVDQSERPIDYANYFDLAKRATAAVSDHTGWLDRYEQDRIPTGPYVRAKMHLQVQNVPLIAWEEAFNHPIAAFAGYETLPSVGRVFVGLVGSASNFLHHMLAEPSKATRTPSDAIGLYDIIQQCRELTENGVPEPGISARQLARERKHCANAEERFQAAAALFTELTEPSTLLEVLIHVHHRGTNVDLQIDGPDGRSMGPFDQVILGAPVWVRTLEPQRDEAVLPSGHHRYQLSDVPATDTAAWSLELRPVPGHDPRDPYPLLPFGRPGPPLKHDVSSLVLHESPALKQTQSWAVFDAQLDAYLTAVSQTRVPRQHGRCAMIGQWPPSGVLWREFGEWFVDLACRLGPRPLPFVVPARRVRLAGLRFGWSNQSREPGGHFGWFVPGIRKPRGMFSDYVKHGVIVLMDGTVWAASDDGVYMGTGKPRPVACDGPEMEAAAAGMLRTVARWRTPHDTGRVAAIEITSDELPARRDAKVPG